MFNIGLVINNDFSLILFTTRVPPRVCEELHNFRNIIGKAHIIAQTFKIGLPWLTFQLTLSSVQRRSVSTSSTLFLLLLLFLYRGLGSSLEAVDPGPGLRFHTLLLHRRVFLLVLS